MKTLFVVPAYNESGTIAQVIDGIRDQDVRMDFEVVVVDDCSSDNTKQLAEQKDVEVLSHPVNLGGGAALRTGFKYAVRKDFDYVICIDGDGQHNPDHIGEVLNPVRNNEADLCIGSRFLGERGYNIPLVRLTGIKTYSAIVSLLSGNRITDCTSGYRAISRGLFEKYAENYSDNFWAVEATIWAGREGYEIEEVAVEMTDREKGSSHLDLINTIRYPISMVYAIFRAL